MPIARSAYRGRSTVKPDNSFYSTFPADENPMSQGAIWVHGGDTGIDWHNVKTVGGNAVAAASAAPGRYSDPIAHLATGYRNFSADQFAQATAYVAGGYSGNGGSHEIELLLRWSISANNAHGYEVLWGLAGYIALVRWEGAVGSYTALYDSGAGFSVPADGDVLYAQIIGNLVTVKRNGSVVPALNNFDVTQFGGANWTSGQPGMGFWPVDGAIPENMGWKDFRAGDL